MTISGSLLVDRLFESEVIDDARGTQIKCLLYDFGQIVIRESMCYSAGRVNIYGDWLGVWRLRRRAGFQPFRLNRQPPGF